MNMILPQDDSPEKAEQLEAFLQAEPLELDFGMIYIGQICSQPVQIKSSCLADVTLSSSLFSIVYFKDGKQELGDLDDGADGRNETQCQIYFKPDKLGPQEKYV